MVARSKGNGIEQGEKANCDVVATEALANPMQSSEARMALQRCLILRIEGCAIVHLHQMLDVDSPQGEEPLVRKLPLAKGNSWKTNIRQYSQ